VATPLPRRAYLAIGGFLTNRVVTVVHRGAYRLLRGRGPLARALGMDMILLTARGRRSGAARTVPLAAVRDGTAWVVVGSNSGKPTMPAWVHNLRADGAVEVTHRGRRGRFAAHEATGPEADRLWPLVVAGYPGFAVYRDRTTRVVPLFVLEPAS
jgi:deazaflavin-dependent oxidoreductase (nitroreductase family)